ncbi:type II toxin-antitoxin system prevent-host-death family antitoxin [Thermosulfurimonas sp.]|uniref:type II toxin-antitoxin system prevent-host-death family antitoxin n=1 Tax=Thermosulfurimonas sp. TaxID=2080236 RepID=UPI0025F4B9B2|nr:type II toxin-antitoxin system prevent-host-death family antitoxin [Thermosulfurimonas sp.]
MEVKASEVKNRLGKYLDLARREPVVISKSGKPAAVLISWEEYQRMREIEDRVWAEMAREAEKEGFLSQEESLRFILEKMKDV